MGDSDLLALSGRPPKTMHGFALGLLMKYHSNRLPYPLRIPDSWEVEQLIRPDLANMLTAKGFSDVSTRLVKKLEDELAAKFQSLDGAKLPLAEDQPDLVNAYIGLWHRHRAEYGYTLLGELPFQAGGVLQDRDDIEIDLDLLIVDEYQDLNSADQRVLSEIAGRGVSIVAIGDDDQSIYSWRNAAPVGIRTFLSTFSTIFDYPLTQSQRCGAPLLDAACDLIEQDTGRPRKPRLSASSNAPATELRYLRFSDNAAEAHGVAAIVADRLASGARAEDIVVLVRSSVAAWASEVRPAFDSLEISLCQPVNLRELLGDPGVRCSLALGRLLLDSRDSLAWRSLLHMTAGIGARAVEQISSVSPQGTFGDRLVSAKTSGFAGLPRMGKVLELTDWVANVALVHDALDGIPDGGWAVWLADTVGRERFGDSALNEFLGTGETLGSECSLAEFLNDFERTTEDVATGAVAGVRIMTIGKSKGLTVDTAIIMGIEGDNVPAPRGLPDEELRLLYVALTRATQKTVVTYARRRKGPTARVGNPRVWVQREQSRFMRDLPSVVLEQGETYVASLD